MNWLLNNIKDFKIENTIYCSILLCLFTLPLPFIFNNIALILLILSVLVNYKHLKFRFNISLLFPILFFFIGAISVIWSKNSEESIKALSKIISLLIIPIIFMFISPFTNQQIRKLCYLFSYSIAIFMLFCLANSFFKFINDSQPNWFLYHNLVGIKVNAIYASVFVSFSFLSLISKKSKQWYDFVILLILFVSLILLSSKNLILTTLLISVIYLFNNFSKLNKRNLLIILSLGIVIMIFAGNYMFSRFYVELEDTKENTVIEEGVINVSLHNALYQEKFDENYYFSGTAIRVYQYRLFKEFLEEDHIFWKGFGLNAAQNKIKEKQIERNLNDYFGELNFHNQYLQTFAELGFFGFCFLLCCVFINLYKAIKCKDFIHLSFALITISFFVTESALNRQRGIMFFILLYCLFNTSKSHSHRLSEQEQ
ncbi:O-antigen ligase family protein [Empedobacter falsenii]|uniref:O-antigen ligase family protein n=1 Tax=Empedobacter falsenii TaxID=343874 RepID=UPI00289D7E28|nr:O-antigen ligase family protein [Empedobacter falsenii]